MKKKSRKSEEPEYEEEENAKKETSLNFQNFEFLSSEENDRTLLKNFFQALQRRFLKKHWTRGEKIDFFIRKSYVWVGLNILLIPDLLEFDDQYNWLPQDTLSWKILFYTSTLIATSAFNDFIIESLQKEFKITYSREERALYQERNSIARRLPKKIYIPLCVFGLGLHLGFLIYEGFTPVTITKITWLDKLLILSITLPLYIAYSIVGIRIVSMFLLDYFTPLYNSILWKVSSRLRNQQNIILLTHKSLAKSIRMLLLERMIIALKNYRADIHRSKNYKNIFEIAQSFENLLDPREKDIYQHLTLLISLLKVKKIDFSISSSTPFNLDSLKHLLISILTIGQIIAFSFFNQIGTSTFYQQNFLLLSTSFGLYARINNYSIAANMFAFMLLGIFNTYLFEGTLSILCNKFWPFFKGIFQKKMQIPLAIQYHRYGYILSNILSTSIVILATPFGTLDTFQNWLLGGYNNEFHFKEVQYTGENAFISFYFPAVMMFGYVAYQIWRITISAFKNISWYFLNEEQRREIQLEKYIKTAIELLKSCKPNLFLQTLLGLSNQGLQQLFDLEDFETLLEEMYRQKGINTGDDKLYCQIKKIY